MLRLPDPAATSPASIDCALTCKMLRTCNGLSPERDSSSSATAPDTAAALMLVPDSWSRFPDVVSMTSSGCSCASVDPGASSPTILFPGATRSGLTNPSNHVGPRELYVAITSSDRCAVPLVLIAPTVIANGETPGIVMRPSSGLPFASFP